jgi:hypothetical protein
MDKDIETIKELLGKYNRKQINEMMNNIIKENNKKTIEEKQIDKTTDKYKVLLKLINKILVIIGKEEINDLKQFKCINRDDLINDSVEQIYKLFERELFKAFDKKTCSWYNRKNVNSYVLTFLRAAVSDIGLDFKLSHTCKHINMKAVNYIFYSIE